MTNVLVKQFHMIQLVYYIEIQLPLLFHYIMIYFCHMVNLFNHKNISKSDSIDDNVNIYLVVFVSNLNW